MPGRFQAVVDGAERELCCVGCAAAARLIDQMGLANYYRFRDEGGAPRPPDAVDRARYAVWDRPRMLDAVARSCPGAAGEREVEILLEGIRCAACVWLVEGSLGQLPGVSEVQVALATGRMRLQWQPAELPLSEVLGRLAALGFAPQPVEGNVVLEAQARARRQALKRLFVAGIGMMQVMTFAAAVYIGLPAGMEDQFHEFFRIISMIVATPVVLYSAAPFFRRAWLDIRLRTVSMDVPVSIAIGGGWAASIWFTWLGHGEVYFDSITMFTFYLLLGRYLEMQARHRAGDVADALARLTPQSAMRLDADGQATVIGVAELEVGDRVRVLPGEHFPADGRIVAGRTHADESLLTGESVPQSRQAGDAVIGGSLNLGAAVDVSIERVGGDTLLSGIARMLHRAQAERPPMARAADRIARWFVGGTLLVACTVFWIWSQLDPSRAFEITLAVLIVTCPCALSLAMPTALTTGTGRLARGGLLVTRQGSLERLARADTVILDKTGTLTQGRIRLRAVEVTGREPAARALALALALESHSEHPLAGAFVADASALVPDGAPLESLVATEVVNHPGQGLSGIIAGGEYRIGNRAFITGWPLSLPDASAEPGTEVLLADRSGLLAVFRVEDQLRPGAARAVTDLRAMGLEPWLASGDQPAAVAEVARRLGIDSWRGGQLPEDKLSLIRELQAAGRRVVMVGDGINDAPVLAGADVSVALVRGTPLAQNAAGMVLTGESLAPLPAGIGVSRQTLRVIRQNLGLSLAYNLSALPLAAAGLVPPWLAAIGMSASSLIVVLNALRLGRLPMGETVTPDRPQVTRTQAAGG